MSQIVPFMQPTQVPLSWEEFMALTGSYSVALDGFVTAGPRFDLPGLRVNFNHHEEVDRLATRATCGQVLLAIRQGFFQTFRDKNGVRADVYMNDCDEDVCLSWFLLSHSHIVEPSMNPLLNRLVYMEDVMDATAGAYPFSADQPILEEMAWIFQPYRRIRLSGELDRKDALTYLGVLDDVAGRIREYLVGRSRKIPLDVRYDRIGGGDGWAHISEIGEHARTGAFSDGIRAFVASRSRGKDALGHETWTHTVGRMSPFIPFNVQLNLEKLDRRECVKRLSLGLPAPDEHFGGGNTIGGSPRVTGSYQSPVEVQDCINEK